MKQNHEQNHRYCVYLGLLEECSCLGLFRAERSLSLSPFVPAVGSKIKLRQKAARTVGYCVQKIKLQQKAVHGMDWTGITVPVIVIYH